MSQNKNLEIKQLQKIYQYIYEAKLENLNSVVQTIIKYFDKNFPYSFNSLLCKFVYSSFISHGKGINKYIQFLKLLETIEEQIFTQNPQIFQILYEIIVNYCTNDSHYIIAHLLEENLISAELVKKHKHYDDTNNPYFMHLISLNDDIENYVHLRNIKFPFPIEELSNNDFALHKKLVHEGHNPNEILKIIRNDEVEKLQEITSQNDFDFNQYIEPSIYERYDFINGYNVTLIDYAAFFGSVKCFKYLLMNGSNVNETSKYAVVGGNTEIILLCKQNHSSFEGAYEAAIKFHRNDIFKYLYENKIVENINLEYLGIKCILYHNYDIFLYLQDEGLEINDEIISEATTDGNLFFIMCFLHNIKDINKIFFKSVRSNNFELVQFLLKQGGIDINRRDNFGGTAFMNAVDSRNIDIVKLLLEQKDIDINAKDNHGWAALIISVQNNDYEMVKLLLDQNGIDINSQDDDGITPLLVACEQGHNTILKLLLEQKGIIISQNKHGFSPLMGAACYSNTETVKILLGHGEIDINAKDADGQTALTLAIISGKIDTVKLLLDQEGIDITVEDNEGNTLLMLASKYGFSDVVELLEEKSNAKSI